jgi:hypothetical protein
LVTTAPFPTYRPAPDSALHALLVEAEARACFSVHFGNPWGDIPTSWVRFLSRGTIGDMEATPAAPSEMMTTLLASPPVGMEDPNEVFLHALSTPATIVSFFLEADINGHPVRWQGAFDPEVTQPRRPGHPTMELKQITGTEVLDLTDIPLLR